MTNIPEGHGIIAGRGYENAVAALAAADAAGVSQSEVLAVDEGYLVPDAVLDAFHSAKGGESVEPAEAEAVGDGDAPGVASPPEDIPELEGYTSPGPEEGSAALPEDFAPEEELPEGAPTDAWKNGEIKAWAEANDVDLGGATKKADMLAAISSADTEEE